MQPKDSWSKIVKKLASDAIHRIFNALPDQKTESLNKMLLLRCFIMGKSESNWAKAVKNKGKKDVGREIKAHFEGAEKTFQTAHVFEKSTCLWKKSSTQYYLKEGKPMSDKFLFR